MSVTKLPPEDGKNIAGLRVVSEDGVRLDTSPTEVPLDAVKHVDDDWSATPPKRTWLLPGLIPDNRISLIAGEGGMGKSLLALQLSMAIASGDDDWLPGVGITNPHGPCSVVYLSYEEEKDEMSRRIRSLGGDAISESIGNRLVRLDGAGIGELWGPKPTGSEHTSTIGAPTHAMEQTKAVCQARDARLLVVDTIAHAFISDETNRGIVTQFLRNMDFWARENRIAVLLLGHPPKSGSRYSGNSAWRATVRCFMSLEMATLRAGRKASGDDELKSPALILDKSNYGVPKHKWPQWWLDVKDDGSFPKGKMRIVNKDTALAKASGSFVSHPADGDGDGETDNFDWDF